MQPNANSSLVSLRRMNGLAHPWMVIWHSPSVTAARLALESYARSGWLWGEVVLVLLFFAALFFPFLEYTSYFNGTSTFDLGFITVLGTVAMVRQATSARTYLLLARLSTRAVYSRGLFLASAALRVPLYLLFLLLVLLTHRLLDPAPIPMLMGAIGLLPNCIILSALTIALSSPMARRIDRILFFAWLAIVLFSFSPVFPLPGIVLDVLSISRIPLWPLVACYTISVTGSITWEGVLGLILAGGYVVGMNWIAGYWLKGRELLLH